MLFKNVVGDEFLRARGGASAVDFMLGLAAKTFTMKDGKLTTTEFSAVNPGDPLTVGEWMQTQAAVADFAFWVERDPDLREDRRSLGCSTPTARSGQRRRRLRESQTR